LLTGNGGDADGNGIRLSMEFDIVETGNAITRSRRSMEFDVVELGNGKHHCDVSMSTEFDVVELGNVGTIVKFVVTAIRLRHCKR